MSHLTSQPTHARSASPLDGQLRLFRHLSLILGHLCGRISWGELDASERVFLRSAIASLSAKLITLDEALSASDPGPRRS